MSVGSRNAEANRKLGDSPSPNNSVVETPSSFSTSPPLPAKAEGYDVPPTGPGMWVNDRWFVSRKRKILKGLGKIYTGWMIDPNKKPVIAGIWVKVLQAVKASHSEPPGKESSKPRYEHCGLRDNMLSLRYLAHFLDPETEDLEELRKRVIHVYPPVQNDQCQAVFLEGGWQELMSSRVKSQFKNNEKLLRVVAFQILRTLQILQNAGTTLVDLCGRNFAVFNVDGTPDSTVALKTIALQLKKEPEGENMDREEFYNAVVLRVGHLLFLLITGNKTIHLDDQRKALDRCTTLSDVGRAFLNALLDVTGYMTKGVPCTSAGTTSSSPATAGGGGFSGQRITIKGALGHAWFPEGFKAPEPVPFCHLDKLQKLTDAQIQSATAPKSAANAKSLRAQQPSPVAVDRCFTSSSRSGSNASIHTTVIDIASTTSFGSESSLDLKKSHQQLSAATTVKAPSSNGERRMADDDTPLADSETVDYSVSGHVEMNDTIPPLAVGDEDKLGTRVMVESLDWQTNTSGFNTSPAWNSAVNDEAADDSYEFVGSNPHFGGDSVEVNTGIIAPSTIDSTDFIEDLQSGGPFRSVFTDPSEE